MKKRKRFRHLFFISIIFIILFILSKNDFYTDVDTSKNIRVSNFSNSITQQNPIKIFIKASNSGMEYIEFPCIYDDKISDINLEVSLDSANGENLYHEIYGAEQIILNEVIHIESYRRVARGEEIILTLMSDAIDNENAYRIAMGTKDKCDIKHWDYNDFVDYENSPYIHIVYNKFGYKTFAVFFILWIVSAVSLIVPKDKLNGLLLSVCQWILFLISPAVLLYWLETDSFNSIADIGILKSICNYAIILALQLLFLSITTRRKNSILLAQIIITCYVGEVVYYLKTCLL